jgi:hypothetical protein
MRGDLTKECLAIGSAVAAWDFVEADLGHCPQGRFAAVTPETDLIA